MGPTDSGITTGRGNPNHHYSSKAAASLIKPHNPRKRKVRGKAGFLVDSDDDEPVQETFRKILSAFPPSSTLQKRRPKARNPFLFSPSPSPPHPPAQDDPNFDQATEENHKTTENPQGSKGSSGVTFLHGTLVAQQPPCQPTCTNSNVSIFSETWESQKSNSPDLIGLGYTTSSEESAAETGQTGSQSTSTSATLPSAIEDTEGSHGPRTSSHSDAYATKETLEEGTAEKKHVSFAEQAVVISPTASELPRSPSEDSLASLFGDDDTDFDKELCLASCASPGAASSADAVDEGPKNADTTPEPDYPQVAVEWKTPEFDYFNTYPTWSAVPSTEAVIATLKAAHDPRLEYTVEPLWEGMYNRFYAVEFDGNAYVLKAALPVCPGGRKTESEVATVCWTRAHTHLPVPAVAAAADGRLLYSASAANPLGCEWILFTRVEGQPLSACWRAMDFDVKKRIVIQLAAYAAAVWDRDNFTAIGNLYHQTQPAVADPLDTPVRLGEMVSWSFFLNGRAEHFKPATGPFATYREWAFARLDLVASEAFARLPQIVDRRLRDVPWRIFAVVARLRVLHDRLFPPDKGQGSLARLTMLWHDNLSADNIFVDDDGVLTGVLDWDSVSCTPRSLADLPALLQDCPDRAEYPDLARHWDFADTHAPRDSYWPLLREAEITELRALFLAEMHTQCFEWKTTYRYNRLRRDFEAAIQYCDHPLLLHVVEKWLDAVDKGLAAGKNPRTLKVWSLQERCVRGIRNKDQ